MGRFRGSGLEAMGEALARKTRVGELCRPLPDQEVQCHACAHRCRIPVGKAGICRVRFNENGELRVPSGYVAGLQVDPIEKKPFYHVLPGSRALSFGMLGCNFHCDFCQNWTSSQVLRDPMAALSAPSEITASRIVALATQHGARMITSTYNEPLITSEWSAEIFRLAKPAGLTCGYVSNGHATPEVLEYLRPWMDIYKVDLKTFNDRNYRQIGGVLDHVLDTIHRLHEMKFWVEVVTLVVPQFNDSDQELREIARFLAGVSPDIPWHVTAFHGDYRMVDRDSTSVATLLRAAEIGKESGLHFVYAGNRPGTVGDWEHTRCPACQTLLIRRHGFQVLENRLQEGRCPGCQREIPGMWS